MDLSKNPIGFVGPIKEFKQYLILLEQFANLEQKIIDLAERLERLA